MGKKKKVANYCTSLTVMHDVLYYRHSHGATKDQNWRPNSKGPHPTGSDAF